MKISHYKLSVLLSIILLSLATFFYIYTTIFTQHGAYANSSAVINGIGGGNITGDCQAGKKALPYTACRLTRNRFRYLLMLRGVLTILSRYWTF